MAYSAKKMRERHWHIALPLFSGAGLMIAMLLVKNEVAWLGFVLLCLGALCVWAPHGPLMSWPAAISQGTAAVTGLPILALTLVYAMPSTVLCTALGDKLCIASTMTSKTHRLDV